MTEIRISTLWDKCHGVNRQVATPCVQVVWAVGHACMWILAAISLLRWQLRKPWASTASSSATTCSHQPVSLSAHPAHPYFHSTLWGGNRKRPYDDNCGGRGCPLLFPLLSPSQHGDGVWAYWRPKCGDIILLLQHAPRRMLNACFKLQGKVTQLFLLNWVGVSYAPHPSDVKPLVPGINVLNSHLCQFSSLSYTITRWSRVFPTLRDKLQKYAVLRQWWEQCTTPHY